MLLKVLLILCGEQRHVFPSPKSGVFLNAFIPPPHPHLKAGEGRQRRRRRRWREQNRQRLSNPRMSGMAIGYTVLFPTNEIQYYLVLPRRRPQHGVHWRHVLRPHAHVLPEPVRLPELAQPVVAPAAHRPLRHHLQYHSHPITSRSVHSIHGRPEYTARFPAVRTHARTHLQVHHGHYYRYAHVHHFRYAHVDESTPIAPR